MLDLLSGAYPPFLFGGKPGNNLPVFHFHDVTKDHLEPYLRYLAENGYKTVTSEAMGRFVRDGVSVGDKTVVLSFDDAWSSMWTVVAPLLKEYNMTAITYAVPGRIEEADYVRPLEKRLDDESPLATWPELKNLHDSGIVDIQAHTYSHARIFSSDDLVGFMTPETDMTYMSSPAIKLGMEPEFIMDDMLGCPLYVSRSRMSDAVRYIDDTSGRKECLEYVKCHGGAEYFKREDWQYELRGFIRDAGGRLETEYEQRKSILNELIDAKEILKERLGTDTIRQVCFPWGVCGSLAEELVREAGYETAVADILYGKRIAQAKSNPYRIMRLKHKFIPCLPGKGRKSIFRT